MSPRCMVIFGATCKSGVALAKRAREAGMRVVAPVRSTSDTTTLAAAGVEVREVDLFDEDSVEEAFEGIPAGAVAVSFVGGGYRDGKPVDAVGNIHLIDAAAAAGAGRFVLVTSLGSGESWNAASDAQQKFLGEVLRLKTRAEEHLKASPLAWTLIRPGGLIIPEPTGEAILVEDQMTRGMINRGELGDLVFRAALSGKAAGKTYAAVDRTQCESVEGGPIVAAEL